MENTENNTDTKELKGFALLVGGVLAGIFGLALPLLLHGTINVWFWAAGSVLVVTGLFRPAALSPVHALWMKIGHILGWVNTRIILSVFYFCILMPVGIFLKLSGWDPMNRKFDPDADTYRVASRIPEVNHFERPF